MYPREAVVAEKFEALVVLGDRNSRIKDFFDLHHLASQFEFDRETVAEAVRKTFARRRTPIPVEPPIGLTPAYWENPSRPAQVRVFARRAGLAVDGDTAPDLPHEQAAAHPLRRSLACRPWRKGLVRTFSTPPYRVIL